MASTRDRDARGPARGPSPSHVRPGVLPQKPCPNASPDPSVCPPRCASASCTRRRNSAWRTGPRDRSMRSGRAGAIAVVFRRLWLSPRGSGNDRDRQGDARPRDRNAAADRFGLVPGPEQHPSSDRRSPQRGADGLIVYRSHRRSLFEPRGSAGAHRDRRLARASRSAALPDATKSAA